MFFINFSILARDPKVPNAKTLEMVQFLVYGVGF